MFQRITHGPGPLRASNVLAVLSAAGPEPADARQERERLNALARACRRLTNPAPRLVRPFRMIPLAEFLASRQETAC